jgi:Endoplasmic Reticulum-Golgi Intermediate Compartment (ERGIC)
MSLLLFLCVMSVIKFSMPQVESDLIIDQKHLAEKLKVHIDIEFTRYPCSFLSLDVENILKVHLVNVMDNLKKISLPEQQEYKDDHMSDQEKLNKVIEDINAKRGCRMKGFFEIDRVPGNFHFSCHGYGPIIHQLVNQGYSNT